MIDSFGIALFDRVKDLTVPDVDAILEANIDTDKSKQADGA
jgi:hypothetical protein